MNTNSTEVTERQRDNTITRYFHPARERTRKNWEQVRGIVVPPELRMLLNGSPLRVGERVVTLVWRPLISDSEVCVEYGASVFHKETRQEEWHRRAHRTTALHRLENFPVVVTHKQMVSEAKKASNSWLNKITDLDFQNLTATDRDTHKKRCEDENTVSVFIRKFLIPEFGVNNKSR